MQVAAELLVDHRAFVDDDEFCLATGLARLSEKVGDIEVLPVAFVRPLPRRAAGRSANGWCAHWRALGAQHLRGLAGEGGEQHLAVDMLGEIAASVVLPVPA